MSEREEKMRRAGWVQEKQKKKKQKNKMKSERVRKTSEQANDEMMNDANATW